MSSFPQRPTLADVAEEAGVSMMTVSRVIEGSPKVAPRTRERVHAAMDTLGYFGNAAASQLVSGRARTVGVVTSNTADFGYASTISGIEQRARQRDMAVLIAVIEGGEPAAVRATVSTVASHALAGVVVIDFDPTAHAVVPALPSYLPTVATTAPPDDGRTARPYVFIDEYEGALRAAEHLIELGHRSIFILAPPNDEPAERRSRGILDALNAARLPHYPVIRCADWKPISGYQRATEVLDTYGDAVTAIACANDEIALGAIRAIHDRGLRVPEDVSVIGFDDDPLAAFSRPALTTIHQDFGALGNAAFDLLMALIEGVEAPPATPLRPILMVRESTAPPHPGRGMARP